MSVKTRKRESAKTFDPYPTKTYKGRLKTPGFVGRNMARKSLISRDKRTVVVMLAPRKEAFYAINFYEFGTSRNPPRPWLEPSFRSSIPQVDVRFRAQLKRLIDKAAKTQ
jgi:HK97 gp10 family phage protein